jgi:hypothetical protein
MLLGAAILAFAPALAAAATPPWQAEPALKDEAAAATIETALDPDCPQPSDDSPSGPALAITSPEIKASLWGPPGRITLSLLKTDVFDRRYADAPPAGLEQIRAGAYAPGNIDRGQAPAPGYLRPDGTRVDPYAGWNAYPFPCAKPVGQIILGLDELAGSPAPRVVQSCRDGTVRIQARAGESSADVEILLSMERNIVAIRGRLQGIGSPWLRLYRHLDQAHRFYTAEDGRRLGNGYLYARDSAWNGPVEAPTSGTDGSFFWIHQRLPAEKTFPRGFDYFLVGWVPQIDLRKTEAVTGRRGLGTPPSTGGRKELGPLERGYAWIAAAPGAAATASLVPETDGVVTAYIAIVTANEAANPLAEAERRLLVASADGFEQLQQENAAWYGRLYDEREAGRFFLDGGKGGPSEDPVAIFNSWHCPEGDGCKPDMRRYEAGAGCVEQDAQPGHGLPRFDELFCTPAFVRNRADAEDLWWKLARAWLPAARKNAAQVYGASGMMLARGCLPPVRPDRYVHTDCAREFCVETAAQVAKVLWDQWDYGGDRAFLRDQAYPVLHDAAQFYASYAVRGADGCYHFVPAVEAGSGALRPGFVRGQDTLSSLCMARWAFLRAAEAAEILGVDEDLRWQWRSLAGQLAPYPTAFTPSGPVFAAIDGADPGWSPGSRPWYIGFYPTLLADEINLDSFPFLKEEMIRTVRASPAPSGAEALVLLGDCPETVAAADPRDEAPIADRRTLRDEIERNPERLLNSRGGRIWVFPCVPAWAEVGFRRFQARGAFLVSAARDAEGVRFLEIEARRGIDCRLMNPWPGQTVAVVDRATGASLRTRADKSRGECIIFSAEANGDYEIEPGR